MENPIILKKVVDRINNSVIGNRIRKYILELSIIYIIGVLIINYILPNNTSNSGLYLLLLFPLIFIVYIFIFLIVRIFDNPLYSTVIIAATLPFERLGALNISSLNVRLSQIFLILGFISYILISTFHKEKLIFRGIKRDVTFYLIILFGIVNILSLAFAINKERSIQVLIFDLFIFFAYIFISNSLVTKEILRKIVNYTLVISLIICIYGLFQFAAGMLNLPTSISGLREGYTKAVFGFPRIQATESEPQFWGNYLLLPLSLSFSIIITFLTSKKKIESFISKRLAIIASIVLLLTLLNLLLTFSRGAWYASIASIGIIFAIYIRRIISPQVILITAAVALIAVEGIIIILNFTNAPLTLDKLTNRAANVQDMDRDLTTRDALFYFNSNPLFGVGVGSFGPLETQNPYQKPSAYKQDIGWRIVNNEYLEILTETGIVGLSVFSLLILTILIRIPKALVKANEDTYTRTIFIGFIGAMVGMLIQYIGFSTLYLMQVWFIIAITNAIAFNYIHNSWKKNTNT